MTSFDAVVIIILAIFLARGIWTGFIRQIAFIAGLLLGFGAAGRFYEQFSGLVSPIIENPQIGFLVTYCILFILVYVLVMTAGVLLKKVMQITFLGWFDHLLGGVFGLGKAVFISTLLFMILAGFMSNSEAFRGKSFFFPFFSNSSRYILNFVKDTELRSGFLPKRPAITPLFTEQISLGRPVKIEPEKIKNRGQGSEIGGQQKQQKNQPVTLTSDL